MVFARQRNDMARLLVFPMLVAVLTTFFLLLPHFTAQLPPPLLIPLPKLRLGFGCLCLAARFPWDSVCLSSTLETTGSAACNGLAQSTLRLNTPTALGTAVMLRVLRARSFVFCVISCHMYLPLHALALLNKH